MKIAQNVKDGICGPRRKPDLKSTKNHDAAANMALSRAKKRAKTTSPSDAGLEMIGSVPPSQAKSTLFDEDLFNMLSAGKINSLIINLI